MHPLMLIKNFSYETLNRELNQFANDKDIQTFISAYKGDYWQRGLGSLLPPATGADMSTLNGVLEKRFVFRNVVRECVDRAAKAFFGKSPNWKYLISGKISESKDETLEKALGDFWTKNDAGFEMLSAVTSRLLTGRGGLRVYLPKKYISEDGNVIKFKTFDDAVKAIRVEFVQPNQSRMLDDEGDYFSIVKFSRREDWTTQDSKNFIEFSYVDDKDLTYIGLISERETVPKNSEEGGLAYVKSEGLDLNGHPTFFEISGEPYTTMGLYKSNQLLNLALTCAGFSLVDNGFGEVFLTNVEMDAKLVQGPDGDMHYQSRKLKRGGGAVQSLVGIRTMDDEGNEQYASPGVHFKDPTAITAFEEGKSLAYRACLEEVNQLYALISGDATPSGESRIQAMKDFYLKIAQYKSEVDQLGSWLMTTVVRLATIFSGGEFNDVEVVFDSKILIGDVTREERNTLLEQYRAGIISLETCRVLSGVDDPEIEKGMIESESEVNIEEVTLDEATRRTALANQLIGLLPERRIRKIAFGYADADLDQLEKETRQEAENQINFSQGGETGPTGAEGDPQETAGVE